MDWLNRMNLALDYIEAHLGEELDYNRLARIACCPAGLFQRIFAVITDLSLSEYIRRRRLTRAAFDLTTTDEKIIDLALKYGYDSPDAFAVAFKRLHNVSPSAAREQGVMLKAYPKLTFSITVKGDIEMNYRIEQKPKFEATGRIVTVTNDGTETISLPAFWGDCYEDGTVDSLCRLAGNPVTGHNLLGVCCAGNEQGFTYMVGIGTDGQAAPEGMETITIPASTWAVFESIGPMPHAIQAVWKRVMGEFLPTSAYRHAGTPDFELYYPGDNNTQDYRSEVWIPVVKKED